MSRCDILYKVWDKVIGKLQLDREFVSLQVLKHPDKYKVEVSVSFIQTSKDGTETGIINEYHGCIKSVGGVRDPHIEIEVNKLKSISKV